MLSINKARSIRPRLQIICLAVLLLGLVCTAQNAPLPAGTSLALTSGTAGELPSQELVGLASRELREVAMLRCAAQRANDVNLATGCCGKFLLRLWCHWPHNFSGNSCGTLVSR